MKTTDLDIIRTARQLRDEENKQLHIRPWRTSTFPTWLVATPAAAIVGFVFGLWTQAHIQTDTPLTALVDTVYIKVPMPQQQQQTTVAEAIPAAQSHTPKQATRPQPTLGHPASDDNIRYDLLVCY
ncbi:MAG: hypothetical protein IKQ37_08905 [Bacteroidaceae bacterium]|nr:hypothetical protein [Bacteroidaceae bacterium]